MLLSFNNNPPAPPVDIWGVSCLDNQQVVFSVMKWSICFLSHEGICPVLCDEALTLPLKQLKTKKLMGTG